MLARNISQLLAPRFQRSSCVLPLCQHGFHAVTSLRKRPLSSTSDTGALNEPSDQSAEINSGVCDKIAFIGSGMMAEALIAPLVTTKLQPCNLVSVFDVSESAMNKVTDKYSVQGAGSIHECIRDADLVVCAVKPQNCDVVFSNIKECKGAIHPRATMLSIVAGKPISSFQASGIYRIARSMPNTPATIGKGVTVWTCTQNICEDFRGKIKEILCCFGKAIYVDDEKFIDMATSISGSGPAYIFMLMEAMIDAGVHMGFSRKIATTLTHQTLLGSTLYAMETGEHPAILKNLVTSPAGTTASALYELESGKFRTVIKDAVWACYRRGLEMGGSDSNVGPGRQQGAVFPTYRAPSGEMYERNGTTAAKKKE